MLKAIWSRLREDRFSRDILKTSLALLYNAAYALFNLVLAWSYQSKWYLMMAMFFFLLLSALYYAFPASYGAEER